MTDEELRQTINEVREMKKMCGNINMKLTNIVTQRGQDFKKKLEAEYQRGFEDGKAVHEKGCEGCLWEGSRVVACTNCCNAYKNKWIAKDDKIEVGDEVNWLGDYFIVTRIFQPRNMKEQCDGIDDDGCVYHDVLMDDLEKTGRRFDIQKILEDMRHD